MAVTLKIDGLRDARRALQELPKATARNVVKRVLIKRAEPIAARARTLVPVRSGGLKRSITVSTKASNPGRAAFARTLAQGGSRAQAAAAARAANRGLTAGGSINVYVGPGRQPHAHLVEFGTSKMAAQPYLRPAVDAEIPGAIDQVAKDLWVEIKKAADRLARKAARRK